MTRAAKMAKFLKTRRALPYKMIQMTTKSLRLQSLQHQLLHQWTFWTISLAWTQLLKPPVTQWALVLTKLLWEDHQLECSLMTFSATWWTQEHLQLNRFNSKTTWTSWPAIHSEKADSTIMLISKPTKQAGTHSVKRVGSILISFLLPLQRQNSKRYCRLRPLEAKTRNRVFRLWRPLVSTPIPSSWNYVSNSRMKVEVQSPTSISWSTKIASASVPMLHVQNTASHIPVHLRHRQSKLYHSKSTNKTLILNHLQRTHSVFNWL